MQNNDVDKLELCYEGMFDRLRAKAAGTGKFISTTGSNIGKIFKGGTAESPRQAYTDEKFKHIIETFKSEMKKLFGNNWEARYFELAKILNTSGNTKPIFNYRSKSETSPLKPTTKNIPKTPEPMSEPKKLTNHLKLNIRQIQKLQKRSNEESRIRNRISELTKKPMGQRLDPKTKYDYKTFMSLKKLAESEEITFENTYNVLKEAKIL